MTTGKFQEPPGHASRAELVGAMQHWVNRAKSAEAELTTLRASLAEYQGAMRAQDQREDAAGVRCGVLRGYSGCDWPDAVAEEVLTLRASLEQARKELAQQKLECSEHCKAVSAQLEAPKGSMFAKQISLLRAELEQVRGAAKECYVDLGGLLLATTWELAPTVRAQLQKTHDLVQSVLVPAPPSPSKEGR